MATTTIQTQLLQKAAAEEYLLLHPETDAGIVLLASEKLTSTNLKAAVEELYDLVAAITGGGVVTGVKGSAETEYRMGDVSISAANIGLGNVDNTADADKPISDATQDALDAKQDKLTFDTTPTESSTNPVTSGGVYDALAKKQDALTIDDSVTSASANPVKSSGIASAIATAKSEVEAEIPDVSEFITKAVSDLTYYYTKTEIDTTVETLENAISAIPKFAIEVVDALPTEDISTTTVYLVKSGSESGNLYTEYIYVNSEWESLGTQTIDLSGYVTTDALNTAIANFLTETDVNSLISTALASYYTQTQVDNLLAAKQDALTIDTELSATSENPVQNKAINTGIEEAKTAASEAASAASEAKTAADAAQSTADTAKTNAATAQTAAETAQAAAEAAQADVDAIEDGTTPAGSATKLATARKISVSGDASGSASFDGSADADIEVELAASGVTAGTYSAVAVNAKGIVTGGSQVVEVGAESQTEPSSSLVVGGIFFKRI